LPAQTRASAVTARTHNEHRKYMHMHTGTEVFLDNSALAFTMNARTSMTGILQSLCKPVSM